MPLFRGKRACRLSGEAAGTDRRRQGSGNPRRANLPCRWRPGLLERQRLYPRAGGCADYPDVTFHKSRHSAFAGTGLEIWLTQRGINRLIVSGIRTEQCCETTTRHASDLGYSVDYITEATLTFPMTHPSGTVFSADDIRKRTELVLAGRFARIATVSGALAPLKAAA